MRRSKRPNPQQPSPSIHPENDPSFIPMSARCQSALCTTLKPNYSVSQSDCFCKLVSVALASNKIYTDSCLSTCITHRPIHSSTHSPFYFLSLFLCIEIGYKAGPFSTLFDAWQSQTVVTIILKQTKKQSFIRPQTPKVIALRTLGTASIQSCSALLPCHLTTLLTMVSSVSLLKAPEIRGFIIAKILAFDKHFNLVRTNLWRVEGAHVHVI